MLLTLYPEGAQPNLLMGTALAEKGELKAARAHLEKALEADRHNQQLLFLYARLLLDMGEEEAEVQAVVDELRRLFPRSRQTVEAYFSRASQGKLRFEDGVYLARFIGSTFGEVSDPAKIDLVAVRCWSHPYRLGRRVDGAASN